MTRTQTPIHSGFSAATTATQVLAGIDLTGQTALVTGGHSGLGLEATKALSAAGASVLVAARNPAAAQASVAGLTRVQVRPLDLASLVSVQSFAEGLLADGVRLHILLANAGVMACPEVRVGQDWESQFATNHLGHYALINRLWPALQAGARVVITSSSGHQASAIRWEDVQFTQGYDKWLAYGQAKTANALCAVHLNRLGQDAGVQAFTLHPGMIATPLQRHIPKEEMVALGWMNEAGEPAHPEMLKSPEQGTATQLWAATSPQLADKGGLYCEDCDVAQLYEGQDILPSGVKPYALDPEQAELLWALSARLTGVNAFA